MTVELDIDENRLNRIDSFSKKFEESRTDFLKRAVDEALNNAQKRLDILEKEQKAVEAYRKNPIQPDEFEVDEEQLIEAWKDL